MGTTAIETDKNVRSAGELLSRDDFRAAVDAIVNAKAIQSGPSDTDSYWRLMRRVLTSPSASAKLASAIVRTYVAEPRFALQYEKDGTWNAADLEAVTNVVMVQKIDESAPDFAVIHQQLESGQPLPTLHAYASRAGNIVLADKETPEHVKAFTRELFGSVAQIGSAISRHAGHILTTDALVNYNGDLTGVLEADLLAGFRSFLTMWAPVPVPE